jgi:hypothetical protein
MSSWAAPPGRRARVQDPVRCTIAAGTRTLPARKASKISQEVQRQWRDADREQGGECKRHGPEATSATDRIVAAGSRRFHYRSSIAGRDNRRGRSTDRRSRKLVRQSPPTASAQLRTYIAVQDHPPGTPVVTRVGGQLGGQPRDPELLTSPTDHRAHTWTPRRGLPVAIRHPKQPCLY